MVAGAKSSAIGSLMPRPSAQAIKSGHHGQGHKPEAEAKQAFQFGKWPAPPQQRESAADLRHSDRAQKFEVDHGDLPIMDSAIAVKSSAISGTAMGREGVDAVFQHRDRDRRLTLASDVARRSQRQDLVGDRTPSF
jgi:hypothetical protein